MSQIQLNLTTVTDAAREAFRELVFLYGAENTKVISEVGAFSDYPDRDIVDLGRLRASLNYDTPFEESGDTFRSTLTWDTEYAAYVHEGYVRRNGRVVQGRPWTQLAAARLNPQETFAKLIDSKLP
jgi:hypothetical protein